MAELTWAYRRGIEARLKNKGIDPDTVDIAAHWDDTLSYKENLGNIERTVGSSLPTKAESVTTKAEIKGEEEATQERYDTAFGEAIERGEAKEPIEEVGWIAKPMSAKKGRGARELKVFFKKKFEKKPETAAQKEARLELEAKRGRRLKRVGGRAVGYAGTIGLQLTRKRYARISKPIKQNGPLSGLRSAMDLTAGGAGFSTGGESLLATLRGGGASQSFKSKEKRTKQSTSPIVNMFMKGGSANRKKWF